MFLYNNIDINKSKTNMETIFVEIGFGILLAIVFGILAKILKQPLVIAYIIAGFVIAPYFFDSQQGKEIVSVFSTIGIAFLLFIVGMEMKTEKILEIGKKVVLVGLLQVLITFVLGFLLSILLGFSTIVSIYIGIALSFSSTVIVVNLLSEKRSIDSLYGKISIGVLILQDVFALIILVVLSGFENKIGINFQGISMIILKVLTAFFVIYLTSRFIIKPVFKYLAHSLDILFLSSIAWCFAVSGMAVLLGFSVEMGAFLAGISLAQLPYSEEIVLKLSPLRDFFLILFFVSLGMQTNFSGMEKIFLPLIVITLFVLIIKPSIIMFILSKFGFTKRTSFYSGVSLSQTSEFSLIIVAIGLSLGHIKNDIVTLVILVTIITILVSSYLTTFLGHIYNVLQKQLSFFDGKNCKKEKTKSIKFTNHIILFGYHRLGKQILKSLEKISKKVLIIDLDPDVVYELINKGKYCMYGDAYDPDLIEKLNLSKAQMIVTTFSGKKSNAYLIKKAKEKNKKIKIISMADHADDAIYLYNIGADYVILPHHLSGEYMASMFEDMGKNKKSFKKIKNSHINFLKQYKVG